MYITNDSISKRFKKMTKEELEKENAELERKLEQTEKDLTDYQFNYPTIKELQKENEELKELLRRLIDAFEASDGEQVRELKVVKEVEQFLKEV